MPSPVAGTGKRCTGRWRGTTRSESTDATGATTVSSASSSVTERKLGLGGPSLVVITGMEKTFRTKLSERDYARVRQLGDEYRSRVPRSVLR